MSKTKTIKINKAVKTVRRIPAKKKPAAKSSITGIHHLFIVDSSGSMFSVRDATISGFNEQVETVEDAAKSGKLKQYVSLYTFSDSPNPVIWNEDSTKLQKLTRESYSPRGSTALNDCIGVALTRLKDVLKGRTDTDVVVTIITDGEENASKDWNKESVKALLKEVQEELKWTITFIGANIDVQREATSYGLSLSNTMKFTADKDGSTKAFSNMTRSRKAYLAGAQSADYSMLSKSVSNFYSNTEEVTDLTQESTPNVVDVSSIGLGNGANITTDEHGNVVISAKGEIKIKPWTSDINDTQLKSAGEAIKDTTKKGV